MKTDVLGKLIHALQEARVEFSAEDLADVLWLAPHLPPRADAVQRVREALLFELDAEPAQSPHSTQAEFTNSESTEVAGAQTVAQQEGVGAYLPLQVGGSSEGPRGIPVHLPDAVALPHALWIARALKPLRRRQETKRILLMNEIRTAEQLAVSDIWFPSFFPGKERWLSAALVIDIGASMAIWQNVIREFHRVLISLGAFRKLEWWWLDTEDPAWTRQPDSRIPLFGSQRSGMYRKPLDIVHPSGRQLIFVVSDCVSDAWWDGRAAQLLGLWGKTNHTVLLQVLPESMWERTALSQDQKIVLRSQRAGCPNSDFKALAKIPFGGLVRVPDATAAPMPVLELEAGALGAWSKWVVQDAGGILPGRALEYCRPAEQVRLIEESDGWAQGPGQPFLTVASRTARKLANIMAVAPPFNLPLLRVIRESMLGGEATQVHEAEFLLSGLVKVVAGHDRRFNQPNDVLYDFQTDELRKLFRAAVAVPDALDLLRIEKVSQFLGRNLGQRSSFAAYLASPTDYEGAIDLDLAANRDPIARFTKDILHWFGAPYDRLVGNSNSLFYSKDEIINRTSDRGMQSDVPEQQAELPLPAKWILVAGTGLNDLPQAVVKSAEQVGRWLGFNRYGLVTGGWKGVDYVVARFFARTLRDAGLPIQNHLVHVVERGRAPEFREGRCVYVDDDRQVYERSVALADGVILIGGGEWTRNIGQHSLAVRKPLYPLASTGGTAQNMHAEMLASWNSISWHPMSREEFLTLRDEEQTLDPIKHTLNRLEGAHSQLQDDLQSRPNPAQITDVSALSGTARQLRPVVDYLIVIPIDEEFGYVRDVIEQTWLTRNGVGQRQPFVTKSQRDLVYGTALLPTSKTEASAVIMSVGRMREAPAQAAIEEAVRIWPPAAIVLVGIAGSLEPDRVQLGDVIVPARVFGYTEAKVVRGRQRVTYRPTGHQLDSSMAGLARAVATNRARSWRRACREAGLADRTLRTRLEEEGKDRPKLHIENNDNLASGDVVVASRAFAQHVRAALGDAGETTRAVEMEAKNFCEALERVNPKPPALVVCGISDLADEAKSAVEESWRRYAAQNATRFLLEFVHWRPKMVRGYRAVAAPAFPMQAHRESALLGMRAQIQAREAGMRYLAFSPFMVCEDGVPETELTIEALGADGSQAFFGDLLLRENDGRVIVRGQGTAAVTVPLKRSGEPDALELLVGLPADTVAVVVTSRDEFGRETYAEWRSPEVH
jgi:nucleoside phosphorylase